MIKTFRPNSCLVGDSPFEVCSIKIRLSKVDAFKFRSAEVGILQVGPGKAGSMQYHEMEICALQIGS